MPLTEAQRDALDRLEAGGVLTAESGFQFRTVKALHKMGLADLTYGNDGWVATAPGGEIALEVYRVTPQNTVGLLECAATHRPTGTVVVRQGRSSAEVQALAETALREEVRRLRRPATCQAKTWSQAQSGERGQGCSRRPVGQTADGDWGCGHHLRHPTFGWHQ